MKKIFTGFVSVLLAVILCAGIFTISAAAEGVGISSFNVADADVTEETGVGVVSWFYSTIDGSYYLFLPESTDKANLRVWFEADNEVTCNETVLVSGEVTDVFAGGSATLSCGDKSYNVVLLDGGPTGSIYINTESGTMDNVHADKEYKEPGTIKISDKDGNVQFDGGLDYIKGRGNTTWLGTKKPYNIKIAKKTNLFGMGKSKKWCLLANGADPSFIRNQLAYNFARSLGSDITSDVVQVGLYLNGVYAGSYILTEKVEIGENRVDITDLEALTEKVNENDLSTYPAVTAPRGTRYNHDTMQYAAVPNNPENIEGGYLLELEKVYRYIDEVSGFVSHRGQAVVIKSPEYATREQVEYIRDYYQAFEDALYSPTGYNSEGKHYSEYADLESIARMYLTEEFGSNLDGCSSSYFLYKDVDGKLTNGPAWDFDLSFAHSSGFDSLINRTTTMDNPNNLYIQNSFIDNYNENEKSFLTQFCTHKDFLSIVSNIWNNTVVTTAYPQFEANVETFSEQVSKQAVMNAIRWKTYGTTNVSSILNSYNSKVNVIRNFSTQHYAYMSQVFAPDSYAVKYEQGDYGEKLYFDTAIYHSGDTATVKGDPIPRGTKHFLYWTTTDDGSGAQYHAGDTLTITENTVLYAQWEDHEYVSQGDGIEECSICHRTLLNGEPIGSGWRGDKCYVDSVKCVGCQSVKAPDGSGPYMYEFDNDGNVIGKYTGICKGYYYDNGNLAKGKGLVEFEGAYYYIGQKGQVLTNTNISVTEALANGLLPAGKYQLGADGKVVLKQGIIDGYYYENGTIVKSKGLIKVDNDYYYIGQKGQVVKSQSLYLSATATNGLLPAGNYQLGADGKVVLKQGIIDGYYYENGTVVKGKGLIKVDDDYYYIGQQGQVVKNKSVYLNTTLTNGLLPAGSYKFDENGKAVLRQGIINGYYYENGTIVKGKGLIKVDNDYYYIGQKGQVVKDKSVYLNETLTNGLLPAGNYKFDSEGKAVLRQGIINGYYYENGTVVKGKGIVESGGYFYYIGQKGQVFTNGSIVVTEAKANGLVSAGTHKFDAEGKMIR